MARSGGNSRALRIALSWMIVLIPLGWGVVQSVVKSLPLFQASSAPEPGSAPAPAPGGK